MKIENEHTLTPQDDWLFEGDYHDPMTQTKFKIGDDVVVCGICTTIHFSGSWETIRSCPSERKRKTHDKATHTTTVKFDKALFGNRAKIIIPPAVTPTQPIPNRTINTEQPRERIRRSGSGWIVAILVSFSYAISCASGWIVSISYAVYIITFIKGTNNYLIPIVACAFHVLLMGNDSSKFDNTKHSIILCIGIILTIGSCFFGENIGPRISLLIFSVIIIKLLKDLGIVIVCVIIIFFFVFALVTCGIEA